MSSTSAIDIRFHLPLSGFTLETDLQLPGKGVTALFGHSGSGKTTLLRCIAGLERPREGFLRVRGKLWQDSKQAVFLPTWKRPLGYVFQEANLFPHLNVRKNLEYGRKRAFFIRQPDGLEQAVELLGISHLLERLPERLSGGERQRVAIARALAVCPQVLLMDEPLAALDLQRKQEILPFLTRLNNELDIPILYVTHSPQEVTRLADYLVVLEKGKVLRSGTLEETMTALDSPLAQGQQASTILVGTVSAYEAEFHLTRMAFPGGEISLPTGQAFAVGEPLRLRVYASDVAIALHPVQDSSILNVLPATITGLANDQQGRTMLRLNVGGTALLAGITHKSAAVLGLYKGMQVFAQIKATAIL
ncbi:molybdenum ABC transporter ATP-binding protein [Thiothrix litoralis]|jgi:molybdate transport system ATP-binding protein|uniref:Molybdenum ABC transporter ATP-binding protein n=1 Tax=Thiothrix litoralis TaxID=2891210 RepID=A0ABX7WWT9_9GAMM|nr:molybdenum ABC transporter ATP-binding protein [Thiothrix litoralis]QTR47811.1 molybdenum ABC transporter ATP-binding protein [Thiothrix litoralis]